MCLAEGPQRSEAGEARTRGPSVSSQVIYHWATALPNEHVMWEILVFSDTSSVRVGLFLLLADS